MKREIWKTVIVDGIIFPRHQISNLGRVKCLSYYNSKEERILKPYISDSGYLMVRLFIDRKTSKLCRVHRLVAEAFLPNPQNKPQVNHIDTNRKNNIVEVDKNGVAVENSKITNLEWCNNIENSNNPITRKHMSENNHCRGKFGNNHHRSISVVQLTLDGQFIKKWDCISDVQRELGIDHSSIIQCCKGKQKTAGGYRWVYASDYKPPVRYISDIKALF